MSKRPEEQPDSHHDHDHHEHVSSPEPLFQEALRYDLLSPSALDPGTTAEAAARELNAELARVADRFELVVDGRRFSIEAGRIALDQSALDQSWNWRSAKQVVPSCRFLIAVTDRASSGDDWRERVRMFRRVLAAIIRNSGATAVLATASSQYLEAPALTAALAEEPGDELFGFVNVRLYKVEGHGEGITAEYDETIMDTIGLSALGLPDLQAHYKHLDPALVAEFLYNTAHYIFDQGPLIESGHHLEGFAPDHKWRCQLEESIVEPYRLVVDLDPGRPYSAGQR